LLVGLLEAVAAARLVAIAAGHPPFPIPTRLALSLLARGRLVAGLDGLLVTLRLRRTVLWRATSLHRPVAIAAIPIPAAVSISAIAIAAVHVTIVTAAEAALIAPEVTVTAVGFVATAVAGHMGLLRLRLGYLMLRRKALVEDIVGLVLTELFASFAGHAMAVTIGQFAAGLLHLLPVGHDDAHVMLGMLQIIFCQHRIARRLSIARKRQILLGNVRRRAPDFHIRPVRLEAAAKRVVVFPVVVVPAAPTAILLSLPHCLSGSYAT
jgi:hypothetical protein